MHWRNGDLHHLPIQFHPERQRQNEMPRTKFRHLNRNHMPRGKSQLRGHLQRLLSLLQNVFWSDIQRLYYLCFQSVQTQRKLR